MFEESLDPSRASSLEAVKKQLAHYEETGRPALDGLLDRLLADADVPSGELEKIGDRLADVADWLLRCSLHFFQDAKLREAEGSARSSSTGSS